MTFADDSSTLSPRRYYALLLGVIAVSALFQGFHFHLSAGSDDQRWIIAARELGAGSADNPYGIHPVYYSRIVWRAVLALWGILSGGLSLESSGVLVFLLSAVSTLMVAESARIAFGVRAALLASAIYATHPLTIVYSVINNSDTLGVTLLTVALYLCFTHLQRPRPLHLVLAGFLVGTSFSAKEYFVLAALPMGLAIANSRESAHARIRDGLSFVGAVAIGLGVDFTLHLWESGSPFTHFTALSDYGDRMLARGGDTQRAGWQLFARLGVERFRYLDWLFFRTAPTSGLLLFMGWLYVGTRWRERQEYRLLGGTAALLLLFLMFMPATFSLSSFSFVEMQPRYLAVLLPMLSIAAGTTLDRVLVCMRDRTVKTALVVGLVLFMAANVSIPNDMSHPALPRGATQRLEGINQVLAEGTKRGITDLMLPTSFAVRVPDSYYARGVRVGFHDLAERRSAEAVKEWLQGSRGRALYVPRAGLSWPLESSLKRGDYDPVLETGEAPGVSEVLDGAGFDRDGVRVPDSAVVYWLARLGVVDGDQELVGWVYRRSVE